MSCLLTGLGDYHAKDLAESSQTLLLQKQEGVHGGGEACPIFRHRLLTSIPALLPTEAVLMGLVLQNSAQAKHSVSVKRSGDSKHWHLGLRLSQKPSATPPLR